MALDEINLCINRDHPQYIEYFVKYPPTGVKGYIIKHWGILRPWAEFIVSRCDLLYGNNCMFPDLFFAKNKPMIGDLEGFFNEFQKKNMDKIVGNKRIKKVLFNTEWAFNDFKLYVNKKENIEKTEVIYPAVRNIENKNTKKEEDEINLLFAGEDFYRKGGDLLYDAFKNLEKKYENIRLTMLSSLITYKSIERLLNIKVKSYPWDKKINEMMSDKKVVWHKKFLADKEKHKIFSNSDVFIFPTRWETFGFVLLEAMTHSLPIITSDIGPIPEIVESEDNALMLPFAKYSYRESYYSKNFREKIVKALEEKISELIENKQLRKKLGNNAKRLANTKYSLDKRNKRMRQICEEALS